METFFNTILFSTFQYIWLFVHFFYIEDKSMISDIELLFEVNFVNRIDIKATSFFKLFQHSPMTLK